MAKVLERDISKKWIAAHLKDNPGDYAFRIHDCPWEAKKFDYLLFTANGVSFALEFKVDRRKKYRYTIDEVPMHQMSALEGFKNGTNRRSKVVVYHVETDTWYETEVQ